MIPLRNPVDEERLNLFPQSQRAEYRRQADERDGGCNDAELVEEMRRDGTLKVLDPKTYALPSVRGAISSPEERVEGYGFNKGDAIAVTECFPWGAVVTVSKVGAILEGGMIRTDFGRIFPVAQVRHA